MKSKLFFVDYGLSEGANVEVSVAVGNCNFFDGSMNTFKGATKEINEANLKANLGKWDGSEIKTLSLIAHPIPEPDMVTLDVYINGKKVGDTLSGEQDEQGFNFIVRISFAEN
ncbi:MAG: hypothetical protein U0T84_06375 [Chitinophagales bacterium]